MLVRTASSPALLVRLAAARWRHTRPELSFDDHRSAFRHKTSWQLLRALVVLRACSNDYLVDNSLQLMRVGNRYLGETLVGLVLRPTVYAQFVAGYHEPELAEAALQLRKHGLRLMVAPTLEEDVDEASNSQDKYERNLVEMLRLLEMTSRNGGKEPCLQLKVTAMLSAEVLKNLSAAVPVPTAPLVAHLSGAMTRTRAGTPALVDIPGVSRADREQISRALERFAVLGEAARDKGVRILVDAEWSYVNPGCSLVALAMMATFNQDSPRVGQTYQCYLQSALRSMTQEWEVCNQLNACFAAKLVRGAYLERERQVNPANTCDTHAHTGKNYNRVLDAALRHVASRPARSFLVVATHNEMAVLHATEELQRHGMAPGDGHVAFAQIYGMAEQISMPLAGAGYIVYKSVPVGRLTEVLPYLSRRVAENRSVMLGSRKERQLLERELVWRIKNPNARR